MATTIKVDNVLADFTWQDDQLLDESADVDYFVKGNTGGYVPQSTVGTGSDAPATVVGASGIDVI